MPSLSQNNNNIRIAKNTIFLYFRMILLMVVSLYTSRVVLATLGIEDYGVYNVVGGIVSMLSFFNGTMSGVTQRYITFALGENNLEKTQKVFSTALGLHWLIAIIIAFFSETIGLWFVLNKLVVPSGREFAAFWVYQFSIFTTIVLVISIPYNACLIAYEKMSAFAYISIAEAMLKLLIVFIISVYGNDKLIAYAALIFCVQLLIRMLYNLYCKRKFPNIIGKPNLNKSIAKSMTGFTVWSFWGGLANVGMTQGLNILLNIFFGPSVNAARAVSSQVENTIQGVVTNFQVAMNPQIIKSYASKEIGRMHTLLFLSCRYSFFLLFLFALPTIVSCPLILRLWLVNIPDHTINFLRMTMLILLVNSLSTPVMTAVNATGRIRKYQVIIGSIQLMIVPVSYFILRMGANAESVFVVYLFITILAQISRLLILKPLINLSLIKFIKMVYYPILKVFFVSLILPGVIWFWSSCTLITDNVFIVEFFACLLSAIICVYYIGLGESERSFIMHKLRSKINRD